jgi:hypothetical protein
MEKLAGERVVLRGRRPGERGRGGRDAAVQASYGTAPLRNR